MLTLTCSIPSVEAPTAAGVGEAESYRRVVFDDPAQGVGGAIVGRPEGGEGAVRQDGPLAPGLSPLLDVGRPTVRGERLGRAVVEHQDRGGQRIGHVGRPYEIAVGCGKDVIWARHRIAFRRNAGDGYDVRSGSGRNPTRPKNAVVLLVS